MQQIFQDFLTAISPALQTLLIALVTVLLGQATMWLNKHYENQKNQLAQGEQYLLDFFVSRAVRTVEQLYFDKPSQEKLSAAIDIVQSGLTQYGVNIDLGLIKSAIEAAVFSGNFESNLSKG